jgi:hypothetical protein
MQIKLILENIASAYVAASRNVIFAAGGPAVIALTPMAERRSA